MYEIIKLEKDDKRINTALKLAEQVFMEHEAPVYPKSGVDNFISYLYGDTLSGYIANDRAEIYICDEDGDITGMMAILNGSHITLAFVKTDRQHQGIGRSLFERILSEHDNTDITVNASPVGIPFYKSLGFVPVDMERIEDGIVFTPMKRYYKCK